MDSATTQARSIAEDETYPVGMVVRPGAGYEWRKDAEPLDRAFVPGGWFLYPKAGQGSISERPPRGPGLLRRFTALAGADESRLLEFANRYGWLGEPEWVELTDWPVHPARLLPDEAPRGVRAQAEPLELWTAEIGAVRDLAQTLDDAQHAALDHRYEARTDLNRHFSRVDGFAEPWLIFTYGPKSSMFTVSGAERRGYRELDRIAEGRELARATTAMAAFARGCVQTAIEQRLQQGAHVGVRYDHGGGAPQPPQMVPATLLGALYLGLDRKIRDPKLSPVSCDHCGKPFFRLRRTGRFCSDTCRSLRWRLDHPDAAKEAP